MISYIPATLVQTPEIIQVWNQLQFNEEKWLTLLRRYTIAMTMPMSADQSNLNAYFKSVVKIWKHSMRNNAHLLEYDTHIEAYRRVILPSSNEVSYAMELQYLVGEDSDLEPILAVEHAHIVQFENSRRHRKELEITYGPEEFDVATQVHNTLFMQQLQNFEYLPGNVFPLLKELLIEPELIDPILDTLQYLHRMINPTNMHIEMNNVEITCASTAIRFILQYDLSYNKRNIKYINQRGKYSLTIIQI